MVFKMKKYLIIFTVVIVSAGVFYLVNKYSFSANNKNDKNNIEINNTISATDTVTKSSGDECCKSLQAGNYSSESIYQLNSTWRDQNNKKVTLGKFKDKNVVLAMFFASCQSACPVIVNDMKIIEAGIPADKINNYRFVLVSIDPTRDTPQALLKYAKEKNLDSSRWSLLTAGNDEVMELAMMLGFKYTRNDNGGFTHTNLISFLNRSGEIIHQNEGLDLDLKSITNVIAMLNK